MVAGVLNVVRHSRTLTLALFLRISSIGLDPICNFFFLFSKDLSFFFPCLSSVPCYSHKVVTLFGHGSHRVRTILRVYKIYNRNIFKTTDCKRFSKLVSKIRDVKQLSQERSPKLTIDLLI